jgi:hypothetical protein
MAKTLAKAEQTLNNAPQNHPNGMIGPVHGDTNNPVSWDLDWHKLWVFIPETVAIGSSFDRKPSQKLSFNDVCHLPSTALGKNPTRIDLVGLTQSLTTDVSRQLNFEPGEFPPPLKLRLN